MIELMNEMRVSVPADETIPEQALTPFRWSIFTQWLRLPGEEAKEFEQRTRVVAPTGDVVMEWTSSFTMPAPFHIVVVQPPVFPIGRVGVCELQIALRESQAHQEWRDIADYPIQVLHVPLEALPHPRAIPGDTT